MALSAEQLEQRKKGIGSSEIAAVAGVSPYEGPLAVWADKTGRAERKPANDMMDMGNDLEPIICRRALKRLGLSEAFYGTTKAHKDFPWALATPDWLIPTKPQQRILETKSVGYRVMHHWSEDETDRGIPDYYNAQVQWQMEIWDIDLANVAAWIGGRDLRVYDVHRDREVGAALLEVADHFWQTYVLKDVQPPIDGTASSERWLAEKFKVARDVVVVADAAGEALAAELRKAKLEERAAKQRARLLTLRAKELLGEASVLKTSLGDITWRQDKLGKLAWGDLIRSLPAAEVDKFRSPPGRRLLMPRAWGSDERDDE